MKTHEYLTRRCKRRIVGTRRLGVGGQKGSRIEMKVGREQTRSGFLQTSDCVK